MSRIKWSCVGLVILLCLQSMVMPAGAFDVPLKSIAQITLDDDGQKLNYPVTVFFDPLMEELYLVNGVTGRIVVYGPDFFPRVSIGSGRGVTAPRGGAVQKSGQVFVVQVRNAKNPSPRITVLNGAFFEEMDIRLDEIPDAEGFVPREVAVSETGLIYLAGDNERGVMVLDSEGFFLRHLQALDELAALSPDYQPEEKTVESEQEKKSSDVSVDEEMLAAIPEEFRPRQTREDRISSTEGGVGPVKVNYVLIDRSGRIYLTSAETGKVYVFGSDEKFLFSFGIKGGSPGQMSNPRAMAIDEEHKLLYVVDYMRHTILVYDLEGKFLFELGGRGKTAGWFNFPSDITINNRNEIIVADLFNKRVQVLEVGYEDSYFDYLEILTETLKKREAKQENDSLNNAGTGPKEFVGEEYELEPGVPDIDYGETAGTDAALEDSSLEPAGEPEIEIEIIREEVIPSPVE